MDMDGPDDGYGDEEPTPYAMLAGGRGEKGWGVYWGNTFPQYQPGWAFKMAPFGATYRTPAFAPSITNRWIIARRLTKKTEKVKVEVDLEWVLGVMALRDSPEYTPQVARQAEDILREHKNTHGNLNTTRDGGWE